MMNKKLLTNITLLSAVCSAVLFTGCTRTLSHGITELGHVEASNLLFPEVDNAWQKKGHSPKTESLSKIKAGIAKDELYKLIGRPHFSEAHHAREWDYIFNFSQEDNNVKVCQYKIIFDKAYKGQEFYWLPADCAKYAQAPKVIKQVIQQPVPEMVIPVVQAPVIRQEKFTLDADALFRFNKSDLANMLPSGRAELDEMAEILTTYGQEGDVRIHLTGHTDRLGSHEYNAELSQRRANTVLSYLAHHDINPATMSASGAGEDYPVKQCPTNISRNQQIECLQPNRRVDADVVIYQFTQ